MALMTPGKTFPVPVRVVVMVSMEQAAHDYNSTSAQWSGMLTKILGRHTLKFGYEGRSYYDNFKRQRQHHDVCGCGGGGPLFEL